MRPENVRPGKFHEFTIIYEDADFAVAYGIWDNGEPRLAMRWNGDDDDAIGYPSQGGNPLWFQLPNHGLWTSEILDAVARIDGHEQRIRRLDGLVTGNGR